MPKILAIKNLFMPYDFIIRWLQSWWMEKSVYPLWE